MTQCWRTNSKGGDGLFFAPEAFYAWVFNRKTHHENQKSNRKHLGFSARRFDGPAAGRSHRKGRRSAIGRRLVHVLPLWIACRSTRGRRHLVPVQVGGGQRARSQTKCSDGVFFLVDGSVSMPDGGLHALASLRSCRPNLARFSNQNAT